MDWKAKGRRLADELITDLCEPGTTPGRRSSWFSPPGAARRLTESPDRHEPMLRERFADVLAAAQWGAMALGVHTGRNEDHALVVAEEVTDRALHLLVEGFRERLTEIVEVTP